MYVDRGLTAAKAEAEAEAETETETETALLAPLVASAAGVLVAPLAAPVAV